MIVLKTVFLTGQLAALISSLKDELYIKTPIKDDVLSRLEINVEYQFPMYYVANDTLFLLAMGMVFKSGFPTSFVECEIDVNTNDISALIEDKDEILLGVARKFKAYNFKNVTHEDVYRYFDNVKTLVDIKDSITDEEHFKNMFKTAIQFVGFTATLNNDLDMVKSLSEYGLNLMPVDKFNSSSKNYEYLLIAYANYNRDMIRYILENTYLKANSENIKYFISINPARKIKMLRKLYKEFSGEDMKMSDFKGWYSKLNYIRSLL